MSGQEDWRGEKIKVVADELAVNADNLYAEALDDLFVKYDVMRKSVHGRTAFITDDSPTMRLMLRDSLGRLGVRITAETDNGFETVRIFNGGESFDFVFLNVAMPSMDGLEALQDFKQIHRSRIIMVTSTKHPSLMLDCARYGAHYILYRPFDNRELLYAMAGADSFAKNKIAAYEAYMAGLRLPDGYELAQKDIVTIINAC